jgi:hypothetical protein
MKKLTANGFALLAAVATLAAAVNQTTAQDVAPDAYIVGSEQILSDTVIGSAPEHSVAPHVGEPVVASGSYAGDISSGSECSSCSGSGCSSCGSTGKIGSRLAGLSGLLGHGGAHIGDVGTIERGYGRPDLFYNYYTNGMANRVNAQMYLSPLPVPPNVGHTFFTYQPFYPEEMLYWHKNKFHNYYDNGRGMNRTRAVYFSPPIRQAVSNLYWNKLRLPR